MRSFYFLVLVSISFFFNSCATVSSERRFEAAGEVARSAGLAMATVKTDPFVLTTYSRISELGKPIHIYIEGDGYAFVTPTRVSGDPTPREPMILQLAAEDPATNVVYLARPCQYTPAELNPKCSDFFWTNGRFSEEVISSMNQAVSYFVKKGQTPGVDLIGYSGGAAVAVLVAARRQDIRSLRTVAGNLDPGLVNREHGATPLDGSLDPLTAAEKIALVPQIHFIGGEDNMIPYSAVESFLTRMGPSSCFQTKTVPEASHAKGWTEKWPELLKEPVVCRGKGDS